ncbi:MAG: hypothetical protein FWD56_03720, partial [Bacteroidales bacterium]|nr:hypothetical protein [Bacteroidales bacterium]
ADGHFDKLAGAGGEVDNLYHVGSNYDRATFGVLMVNHNTMASVFWPATSTIQTGVLAAPSSNLYHPNLYLETGSFYDGYCFYPTSSYRSSSYPSWHTHWCGSTSTTGGHIGMSCTAYGAGAVPVRCFKIDPENGPGTTVDDFKKIWE